MDQLKCGHCGTSIKPGDNFCSNCGAKQSGDAEVRNKQVVYFKNGYAYKMVPPPPVSFYENRDLAYNADFIVSENVVYDLSNPDSIAQIKVPDFGDDSAGVVAGLDYILRMKAGHYYQREEDKLCSALLWKSTELMLANSNCFWSRSDLNRIIYWHYELNMPDEAEKARKYLMQFEVYTQNRFDLLAKRIKDGIFANAKKFDCDLVVFHDYGTGCCEECIKHVGRVYSISGRSKKYPSLPHYVKEHGNFHPGCRCAMSSYSADVEVYLHGNEVDALQATFRPYVDDRSPEEKAGYLKYLETAKKEQEEERARLQRSKVRGVNRGEYRLIKKNLPDIAPKSLDGYIKMKKSNSRNFAKITKAAKDFGICITPVEAD